MSRSASLTLSESAEVVLSGSEELVETNRCTLKRVRHEVFVMYNWWITSPSNPNSKPRFPGVFFLLLRKKRSDNEAWSLLLTLSV